MFAMGRIITGAINRRQRQSYVFIPVPSTISRARQAVWRVHPIRTTSLNTMATTKKSAKTAKTSKPAAPKAAPKTAPSIKPVKDALTKNSLTALLAEQTGVDTKSVKAVLAALEGVMLGSVHKKGLQSFTLPGLLKIEVQKIPAKPKRKGINPFTKQEQVFAAKPATVRIKARALKKLKDAAL